ncbi:Transcription initiation factor IIB [Linnemannia zychae]|nr:Transcription initiation factor IIB [Linnemannia zychae]
MERAEHVLPPERMMPGREPPSAIVQPHFHPNGQQPQFPAGAEMTRNGLVSPRDGVFNETPPGSTRSVSPDSQMDRKRGRRPKPKLDTEIVAVPPPSMGNSPNTLVPRAGPETLPEQPSGKKRGRKPKGDPKAAQRNWNSVSQDPHRQSFGHADAMLDNSKQDPAGHYPTGSDDFSDASRSGRRIEVDHGYSPNGPHERAGQDISHHDKRFMEDEARGHSDPRFERQPVPFDERPPPVSVEEFEHQQRLRTQQKEQKLQQEQHLQHQQHPEQHQQQYSHPPAPGSPSRRYENGSVHVHALELHSVRSPLDHERQCIVDGHEQVGVQSLGPAGKEPEMVHRLEAVVANALVNIQHENRFQSPDGASYSEGDPNKRLRLDSPGRSIEPHAGHGPHLHRPHSQQADPHPAQSLDPVAIGRQDLAKDEQDAVLLLQSMIDDRRAMEQADPSLLHQGQVHHDAQNAEFSNGYPPRPVSPRTRAVSQHRDSMQHQPRHPQDVEHMSVDPHQYDRRLQDPQMLSPHPPYGHGQAYPPPEPASFDPHHGSAGDDHPAHQRHSSLGNATQPLHSSQRGPETFHEHGGENNGVYHPYPTERDVPGRPRRSSGNVAPHTPNAVQHNDQWHNGSPAHGRIDIADTPYPALHRDMPMEQQHPHHHGQPNQSYTHSHAPPQGQWPVDRPDNRGPPLPPHGGDANVQQPVSQESNTSVGIIPTKTKGRGKGKARAAGMMSAEIKERPDIVMTDASFPTNERDYDPRTQQYLPQEHGAPFHPPPAGATGSGRGDIQGRLQSSGTPLHYGQDMKAEVGAPFPEEPSRGSRPQSTDSKQASSGKRQVVSAESAPVSSASANGPPSAGISERLTPSSLRFGSGVILVQKLNDASGYGTSSGSEGSTKFPPSQLSIKTGYDLSKTTGPTSSTFSPSTPLSAVATALAVKKKRPKLIDIKDEIIATSPGSTHGKGDPLPPPPPPTKGKGGNRGRKGLVLVGSTDADIERSNQITRSGGPAWMMLGTNAASNSSSSSNGVVTVGAGAPLTSPTAPTPAGTTTSTSTGAALGDGSGIRRRAPLSTSTLLVEDGKRKPKRIKIDDKDVRQVQRTSSTLTEATEADRKEIVTKSAENDELEEGDTEVAAGDGCSNGMGSQRRRLPEEDDEDLGEEEVGRRAAGNEAQGRRQSHAQSQSQTQQPQNQDQGNQGLNQTAGGSKTMKRKSNASLSGTQLSKKAKEKSKAVDPDVETMKANGKAETPQPSLGRSVVMGIPLKRGFSAGGSGAATPTGDTDAESDLAMEDDIKCPHIFGLDSESEHEIEEEVDDDAGNDDDDDSKSAVSTPGKANGSSDQAGSSSSSKVEGVLDPLDPLQVQGLKWVKTLGMTEKAWEETFRTYERVKRLKELKNRQPVRKRDAILAAILYIVCRDEGSPRTFSEICTASGVRRGDIGAYYRLMLKVLKPSKAFTASARDTDAEAFMTRWCESLSLPPQVRQAAIHVFSLANTLNLTSGKCPSSVGAAAIYLCIFSWNNARRLARCKRYQCPGCQGLVSTEHPGADQDEGWIRKEQKDVAVAVGVVSATLMGCFRNLAPESDRLVPVDFLHAAEEGV